MLPAFMLDHTLLHGRWERARLSTGRTIDVLRLCGDPDRRLEVCPSCRGELVQPVWWEQQPMRRWRVALWCPECAWETHGVFQQEELERFDAALDRGSDVLLGDLRAFTAELMQEEAESLRRALDDDLLGPDDFR
jgi:hypothetical protein